MVSNADKSEETRRALIRSTSEIISRKGYSKTTLEDIAKNINMTRGAFYCHFKNKKEILQEIENLYETQYLMDYSKLELLPSAYDTLCSLITHQIKNIFNEDYISYAFIIRYRIEALSELPDLLEKQRSIDNFSVQRITEQIERGKRANEFRADINARQAALGIFTIIVGVENVKMLHMKNNDLYCYDNVINVGLNYLEALR